MLGWAAHNNRGGSKSPPLFHLYVRPLSMGLKWLADKPTMPVFGKCRLELESRALAVDQCSGICVKLLDSDFNLFCVFGTAPSSFVPAMSDKVEPGAYSVDLKICPPSRLA